MTIPPKNSLSSSYGKITMEIIAVTAFSVGHAKLILLMSMLDKPDNIIKNLRKVVLFSFRT